jgi:hypothetical protein
MAKTKTVATRQARRAVPYIDVAPRVGEVTLVTPAQLAARRVAQRAEYVAWRLRQDELAERDRRVRDSCSASAYRSVPACSPVSGWPAGWCGTRSPRPVPA